MSTERIRAAAAYGAFLVTAVAAAATVGLFVKTRSAPVDLDGTFRATNVGIGAAALAFAAVSAVIIVRQPGNAVGWLFCGIGLFLAVGGLAQEFAVFAVIGRTSPLAGGAAAAWFQQWSLLACVTFGLGLLLLLFPDGRPLTRRWRVVAWAIGVGLLLFCAGYAVDPAPVQAPFASVDNPFGVEGAQDVASVITPVGFFLSMFSIVAAAVSLVLRYRRSGGIERQQIKWLASIGAVFVLVFLADIFVTDVWDTGAAIATAVLILLLAGVPVAAGLAVLRHHLYDIDVVINRTLVYGTVTALLAGTYIGLVLLFQLALDPITNGSGLAVAFSTLAVAALFRPARTRIQVLVDRRFYRSKYDAQRTLERFAAHLRDEVDLEALRTELTAAVAETMQPAHVSLWLRTTAEPVTPAVTIPRRPAGTREAR